MGLLSIIGIFILVWFVGSVVAGWNSAKSHNQEVQFRGPDVNSDDFVNKVIRENNDNSSSFINDKFGYLIKFDYSKELFNLRPNFNNLKLHDGSLYEGEVTDGLMNGFGTLQEADGTTIQGLWRNGKKNGIIIVQNSDILRKYTYKDDILHGISYWDDFDGNYHYLEYNNNEIVKLFQKYPNGNIAKII